MLETLKIVLLCVVSACLYGILHDQVTARVCIEYFTIGHPPVFNTDDPTLIGIGWGILATWWVGVILGLALAAGARLGTWPKRTAAELVPIVIRVMAVSAVAALFAGVAGLILAMNGSVMLWRPLSERIPHERHRLFLACLFAHTASYFVGFIAGVVAIGRVVWRRWEIANSERAGKSNI